MDNNIIIVYKVTTLGARGYFFREIEREIRGGAASAKRREEKNNLWSHEPRTSFPCS